MLGLIDSLCDGSTGITLLRRKQHNNTTVTEPAERQVLGDESE